MASKLLNCPPNSAQRSALNAIIARQESLVAHIRGIQGEDEKEHERLAVNVGVLQRSALSTNTFRNVGTQIRDQLSPALIELDQLLLSTETDHALLSSLLPSTKTLLIDWTAVRHALATLLSILEGPVKKIEECVVSIAEELHNTEVLRDQMSDATAALSDMIERGLKSIKSKKESILHPIRRLPDETILQIFEECIEEERDCLRGTLPFTGIPRSPSTLAAVCNRWRQIVLHIPQFWNYICWPPSSWNRSRLEGWEKMVSLAKTSSLEITVPLQSWIVPGLRRLDITDITSRWPSTHTFPSIHHLWIGHSGTSSLECLIPAAILVSSATRLSCFNVIPLFQQNNQSLRAVSIKGAYSGPFFGSMMRDLQQLQKVDMTQLQLGSFTTSFNWELIHHALSHLAINASALAVVDCYLMRGLRLPNLRRFAIEDVKHGVHSASNYPSIASQFKPTVAVLEISGTPDGNSVLSWIEALLPLEELVTTGERATLITLDLLCQPFDSKTDSQGATRPPLKGLTSLVIHEYMHEGTSILQQLKDIRRNPHPESPPVNIFFERCPNILLSIKTELLRREE